MKNIRNVFAPAKFSVCFTFILILIANFISAGIKENSIVFKDKGRKNKPSTAETTKWLKTQPVEFLENRGQIMNTENKPAANVFFKAEAPGVDLYVTSTGLSYVFLKYEEKEKSAREKRREAKLGIVDEEEVHVTYEKIDLCLDSAPVELGTATISILSAPVITISGRSSICINEKATYTASGAASYTWSTGTTTSTLAIQPTFTTVIVYTVTSPATNGCTSKKTFSVNVNKCTGVEDVAINSELKIFPNPNNGQFTVSSEKDILLELVDEVGRQIKTVELSEKNNRKVVIENLSIGIYFLRDKNMKSSTNYKIVVTK